MDNIRPSRLEDFVGQERVRHVLAILCRSAKKNGRPVPHLMLAGPPGLGKTSLARIVAEEMGGRLVEMVASNVQSPDQMIQHLLGLRKNDLLFVDEIHGLPRVVEEVLYSALEDRKVTVAHKGYDTLMRQIGLPSPAATVESRTLNPFTCIGATTLAGLVSDPLRTRFSQILNLEPYGDEDLARIAVGAAAKMNLILTQPISLEIAKRSRGTARVAVGLVGWLSEFCSAYDRPPDADAAKEAFALKDIDEEGLTGLDRSYLSILIASESPMGLSTIASALSESTENLAQAIEPFLIRRGYIQKGPRGRVATAKAVQKIGLKVAGASL